MALPIVLIMSFLLFPSIPAVQVERFETERECPRAAAELDQSTPLALVLTCVVAT